jgi:hypothetical protein
MHIVYYYELEQASLQLTGGLSIYLYAQVNSELIVVKEAGEQLVFVFRLKQSTLRR